MASTHVLLLTLSCLQLSSLAEVNVYGKPMTGCGPNHGAGCTYSAMDAGAHEVCVTQLSHGFSSVTGQGPWSDEFTGQPWCICIWAYSNYILQNKDFSLKCESIPAKVLEEQYSLDKFKQCGSLSSTAGCGPEDIRRSIQTLCSQCDQQAGSDETSRSTLKSKCATILAAAPEAPMKLYSIHDNAITKLQAAGVSPLALGVFAFTITAAAFAVAAQRICGAAVSVDDEEAGQE